ncbi:MAG TPA: alpha/beta hydrolase [Terriglobia bacterium]|nr:alpha/beta hydrolase [Terriglobia bacterium]
MRSRMTLSNGVTVSYSTYGNGAPLVLVHGGFSDDVTNWEFVKPLLEDAFTIFAIARRGRGETTATQGHTLEDEARDVVALIEKIGQPVFLLGHSYGARCSLVVAEMIPSRIRKLVVYEPPRPGLMSREEFKRLEALAAASDWDNFACTFFRDVLHVPEKELQEVRASDLWPPILSDAKASLGDLSALNCHEFIAERYRKVDCPVLLQIGSESRRDLWATDMLAATLSNARIETLEGQAHEGMTTAPEQYAASVRKFFLGQGKSSNSAWFET